MARVTAGEVKLIMDNCTLDNLKIDAYIVGAHNFINTVFAEDAVTTVATLKELERWFTAHMIASTSQRISTEEEVGDARIKYAGKWEEQLKGTPYGQMVLTIDTSGKVGRAGKLAASIIAIKSFE